MFRPVHPVALTRPMRAALRAFVRDEAVAWVAVFGSRARAEARPGSDADVAVGLVRSLDCAARSALLGRLETAWRGTGVELDLLLVDGAGLVIRYVVASDGILVAARDPLDWARFRESAIVEYLDELPVLRFHEEALRQRIHDGAFAR
jgi:predicted nucleotidyltransferase